MRLLSADVHCGQDDQNDRALGEGHHADANLVEEFGFGAAFGNPGTETPIYRHEGEDQGQSKDVEQDEHERRNGKQMGERHTGVVRALEH